MSGDLLGRIGLNPKDIEVERLARLLCAEPDGCDTLEAHARATHHDIEMMTLDAVDDERFLARLARALMRRTRRGASTWLVERVARLDQAAAQRRRTT